MLISVHSSVMVKDCSANPDHGSCASSGLKLISNSPSLHLRKVERVYFLPFSKTSPAWFRPISQKFAPAAGTTICKQKFPSIGSSSTAASSNLSTTSAVAPPYVPHGAGTPSSKPPLISIFSTSSCAWLGPIPMNPINKATVKQVVFLYIIILFQIRQLIMILPSATFYPYLLWISFLRLDTTSFLQEPDKLHNFIHQKFKVHRHKPTRAQVQSILFIPNQPPSRQGKSL